MASPLLGIASEICVADLPGFLDAAQPIGRLASSSRSLAADLKDSSGRLRVSAIVTGRLSSAMQGLKRASLHALQVFKLDLSRENQGLSKHEIESAVRQLGESLCNASALQVLAVRLASFDTSMERLRLGVSAWQGLVRCLGELAGHTSLRVLELSSINIKNSRITQDVNLGACCGEDDNPSLLAPARSEGSSPRKLRRAATEPAQGTGAAAAASSTCPKLSFLDALAGMSSLEELALTHDEIFGDTAQLLPPVFQQMERLKRVDLTRNHIPKPVMHAVRQAMPKRVTLCGDDLQTFYFY